MAVLKIYTDIKTQQENDCCRLWDDTEGVTFADIDDFVSSMAEDDNLIDMRLHCDGGNVTEGWAIYDKLRSTGKEIHATIEGNACSMATIVMLAAPKEHRYAYGSAHILVHNPYTAIYSAHVNADDLAEYEQHLREEQNRMLDLYVERCGCDREEMQQLMNEDKFIDAQKAIELGLIGSVIAPLSAKSTKTKIINQNTTHMKKDTTPVSNGLIAKLCKFFGKQSLSEITFGMSLNTADGSTLEVEREEGEPQVGDAASPDGEHLMPDGSTIVVKEGVITEIKPAESAEGNEGNEGEEETPEELQQEIEELQQEVEELKEELAEAKSKAKTTEDLRILNAVKMAGGEKAIAQIASNYKPEGRMPNGKNATANADNGAQSIIARVRETRKRK
jgi:ATP-dependent protease ClpP protease subunit/ribosomal protein L29